MSDRAGLFLPPTKLTKIFNNDANLLCAKQFHYLHKENVGIASVCFWLWSQEQFPYMPSLMFVLGKKENNLSITKSTGENKIRLKRIEKRKRVITKFAARYIFPSHSRALRPLCQFSSPHLYLTIHRISSLTSVSSFDLFISLSAYLSLISILLCFSLTNT